MIGAQLGACRDKRRLKCTSVILPSHALGLDRFERKSVSTLSILCLGLRSSSRGRSTCPQADFPTTETGDSTEEIASIQTLCLDLSPH